MTFLTVFLVTPQMHLASCTHCGPMFESKWTGTEITWPIVFKSLRSRSRYRCVFKSFHSGDRFRVDGTWKRNKMFAFSNKNALVWTGPPFIALTAKRSLGRASVTQHAIRPLLRNHFFPTKRVKVLHLCTVGFGSLIVLLYLKFYTYFA